MALQMLFQHDLGASALSDVLRTFDPEDYIRDYSEFLDLLKHKQS